MPASNSISPTGAGALKPKLMRQDVSKYFDRRYSPTEEEVEEMDAIREDLLAGYIGENESLRNILSNLDEDERIDKTTNSAIKSIFFPTPKDLKSVFCESGSVRLYEPSGGEDQSECELMVFTNGFLFCKQVTAENHAKRGLFRRGGLFDIKEETEMVEKKPKRGFFRFGSSDEKNDLKKEKKVTIAFLLSDIERVELLSLWKAVDIRTHLNGNNDIATSGQAFAIFIYNRQSPIIVVCPSKEEVDFWINVFRVCVSKQKSNVLGKDRETVMRDGLVFGINNTRRTRHSLSNREFGDSIQWDCNGDHEDFDCL